MSANKTGKRTAPPPANASGSRPPPPRTATRRRGRYALNSVVTALAATAACAFLLLIASRLTVQITALSTREHVLAERTQRMIEGLDADYDIIIAANFESIDPEGAQRTLDVLDTFNRASDRISVTVLDIAQASGVERFTALMDDLVAAHEGKITEQADALLAAAESAEASAQSLNTLNEHLARAAEQAPADWEVAGLAEGLTQRAAAARLLATDLVEAATAARAAMEQRLELAPIPPIDLAYDGLQPVLRSVAEQVGQLVRDLERISNPRERLAPEGVIDALRPALETGRRVRDTTLRAADALDRTPPLAILSVARTLERTSAVIVVGPPDGPRGGVTAVDFSTLFPPRLDLDERPFQIDQRQRAEELLATAIGSVSDEHLPIVVFLHAEEQRFSPRWPVVGEAMERLSMRGVAVAEWPVMLEKERPDLSGFPNAATRPVVYMVLPTNPRTPQDALRMNQLVNAIEDLVDAGENVLLSVHPSTLPTTGNPDPMVSFLERFGMTVDTGRPLLQEGITQQGRVVTPIFDAVMETGDHPLAGAIRGLRTRLPWPMPIRVRETGAETPGVRISPVIRIEDNDATWAESDWVAFSQVPASQHASVVNPPDEDSARDDGDGPWTVVAAVEAPREGQPPQRLVVVTSGFLWMSDPLTQAASVVGSRRAFHFPGNLELLESSVFWLAGRDEYVATSAAAQDIARIKPIGEGQMLAIRWLLIGGMPLAVLLIGALVRLIRG